MNANFLVRVVLQREMIAVHGELAQAFIIEAESQRSGPTVSTAIRSRAERIIQKH